MPFIVLVLATSLGAQQERRITHSTPADVAAGAKTFRSHCAPCHGLHGEGGRGPNLASGRFNHGSSDTDIFDNISQGIPGTEMPGIFYTDDRLWQLVAYLRSLSTAEEKAPGDVASGAALFRLEKCSICHRISGQGGALGPDLTEIGAMRSLSHLRQSIIDPGAEVRPRYWVVNFKDPSGKDVQGFVMNEDTYTVQLMDMTERLHTYEKSALKDYRIEKRSIMPSFRDSLTSNQLNDLVAYLSSCRP